jgi:hypothetical protein
MSRRTPEAALGKWLAMHPTLGAYMDLFSMDRNSARAAISRAKREAIHNRMVSQLIQLVTRLRAEKDDVTSRLPRSDQEPRIRRPNPIHDDPARNLALRAHIWAEQWCLRKKLRVLNIRLSNLTTHIVEADALLLFFRSQVNVLPVTSGVRIRESFFVSKGQPPPDLVLHCERLRKWAKAKAADVALFDVPPAVANFRSFFDGILANGVQHMDPELSYVEEMPGEVEMSRAIFCGPSRRLADEVDQVVEIGLTEETHTFLKAAVGLSLRLIPDGVSRSPREQSVGMMMFFRVIFNRLYERRPRLPTAGDLEAQSILTRLARIPVSRFQFPLEFDDKQISIREFFSAHKFFHTAALFMEETMYVCNPIDCLYFVHRALVAIHKATLLNRSGTREVTTTDLRSVMPFDDLFAILVGVTLATDIPDFFSLARFMDKFTPQKCLSNAFEYAQAAISALVVQFEKMAVDAMDSQAEALEETGDT